MISITIIVTDNKKLKSVMNILLIVPDLKLKK